MSLQNEEQRSRNHSEHQQKLVQKREAKLNYFKIRFFLEAPYSGDVR